MDVKIEEQDISVSHRMPLSINKPNAVPPGSSRGSSDMPVIVVKCTNRNVRDRLYRARSNLKNFTVGDIGLGRFGDGKIFIQESLTVRRRKLFKQCLEIRKIFYYKFIWTYYGTIYLRNDVSSLAVRITSSKDLEMLKSRLTR